MQRSDKGFLAATLGLAGPNGSELEPDGTNPNGCALDPDRIPRPKPVSRAGVDVLGNGFDLDEDCAASARDLEAVEVSIIDVAACASALETVEAAVALRFL